MSDLVFFRFQPDAMDEDVLRKLFVGRNLLLKNIEREIRKAVKKKTPRYFLIVGSRGIGKSHFVTLLYYNLKDLKDAVCVKLSEDEFSLYRAVDLFRRVFEEVEGKKYENNFELENDELIDAIVARLKNKNKMIIIFIENLYQIFSRQMDKKEIKRLRSIFQEEDIFIVIATAPFIFRDINQGEEPFYNFFDIRHLKGLSKEEIKEMIRRINQLEGKSEDVGIYSERIDPIIKLTGGSPRIVILLYDLMCKKNILDVEQAFFKILDEHTPYYQDIFRSLAPQQRMILDTLISLREPSTPKDIARAARLDNVVVGTQLKRLEKDGYVASHKMGKNVKYEVRERLFRLWREQRQPFGRKRISILIEFLSLWYTPIEREREFSNVIDKVRMGPGFVKQAEYLFHALPEKSKMEFIPEITRIFCDGEIEGSLDGFFLSEDRKVADMIKSEEIRILLEKKEYKKLLEKSKSALERNKDDAIAWVGKGVALKKLQDYEEALESFDRALEINPDSFWAWYYKGLVLGILKNYEEALESFDRALRIKTDSSDLWNNRGFALLFLENYEGALESFNRALEIDTDSFWAWFFSGIALENLENYEEALESFNRALKINPNFDKLQLKKMEAHLNISIKESKNSNTGNFIENLNSAIDSVPENYPKREIEVLIIEFFKKLIILKQFEAIDISLETISKKEKELVRFLKPISTAIEIIKTKNIKKYYEIQVEERDIVVDIVKGLTESEEYLPEEYKKGRSR